MAKLKLGSKLLRGAQKVGRGAAKAGKIFNRVTNKVTGGVKSALPGGSARGKVSKVRGKMSLVPQALQPPEKSTPQARVRNIGKLVENKVQNLVPKLSKAVQRSVNAFDPQAFLGKIFDGGLNSLQNFASGLGGLQTSLQKSMGFINESKGIIVDLIERMAKAKPRRARGGIIKGLLKGAAVVGLATLAIKAAPAVGGAATAVGGALFRATPLGMGITLAKKIFGRKKKDEEGESKVKGEEINETFKESLDKFDETLSKIDMRLKGARYRRQKEEEEKRDKEEEEKNKEETKETVESEVKTEVPKTDKDLQPSSASDKPTDMDKAKLPDPNKKHDENVDANGKPIKLGETVGEDPPPKETKVEAVSDVVNNPNATGGPDLTIQPSSVEFLKGDTGETGSKGNRGALGSTGEAGKDVSSVKPTGETEETPKPQGISRGLAGLGDFLTFGLTDFDQRGDLFKKDDKTKVGVKTDSDAGTGALEQIKIDTTSLESRSKITDGISQPAQAAAMEAAAKKAATVALPIGQKRPSSSGGVSNVMSRMANEVPTVIPVDLNNIHITTSKALFNIVDVL